MFYFPKFPLPWPYPFLLEESQIKEENESRFDQQYDECMMIITNKTKALEYMLGALEIGFMYKIEKKKIETNVLNLKSC